MQQAGYPLTDDVNGYRQEGFAAFDRTIYRGRRLSAARAFLHPVMDRPNLEVRTRAFVSRASRSTASAPPASKSSQHRQTNTVDAGQVILCGGAINTPQMLQLSGVGDARELEALGIRPIHDLSGVGENLQDHLEVYVQHACTQPVSVAPAREWKNRPKVGLEWLLRRSGPGATNHFEAGGFIRSGDQVAYPEPDVPLPAAGDPLRRLSAAGTRLPGACRPDVFRRARLGEDHVDATRAHIRRSASTISRPQQDRREWVEAIHCSRHILSQPAFAPFDAGELSPGPAVESDEEVLSWVARDAETALHPSCTCRMGIRRTDVVDPNTMSVHGLDRINVADASAMPYVTNGNIYAPVIMLAEKAADLIAGRTPLEPIPAPFYRREPAVVT